MIGRVYMEIVGAIIWRLVLPLMNTVITVFIISLTSIPVVIGTWIAVFLCWLVLINGGLSIASKESLDV